MSKLVLPGDLRLTAAQMEQYFPLLDLGSGDLLWDHERGLLALLTGVEPPSASAWGVIAMLLSGQGQEVRFAVQFQQDGRESWGFSVSLENWQWVEDTLQGAIFKDAAGEYVHAFQPPQQWKDTAAQFVALGRVAHPDEDEDKDDLL